MKRLMVLLGVMGTALMLAAGVALAANIDCPNRSDGRCVGTLNDDTMVGSGKADKMRGRPGNDTMTGLAGPDVIVGDAGADNQSGGDGKDVLKGGEGADILDGRDGDDRILAAKDRDSDSLTCGPGQDFARVTAVDVIEGQEVGGTPESVLEAGTNCEDVDVVLIDNPPTA
jgi:Ca2+-binding RTX toxin-like protein